MNIWKKILNVLNSITKKDIIYTLIIILLIGCLGSAVKQCSDTRFEYKNNIAALNNTIRYYQDKNGNLVATKLAFESDINTLKLLNEDLYNQIKDLKAKGNITEGTYFAGVIENPKQDTAYVVTHDTISKGFIKDFAFNNEYRTLEGNVSYKNDTVGVNIEKDQVIFDYIVALDDKNNIMIRSTNPYVKYNEITGFRLPQNKTKHWSLNAFGNFAWKPAHNNRYIDLGVSMDYNIKRLTIGPMVFLEKNFATNDKAVYIGANASFNILKW